MQGGLSEAKRHAGTVDSREEQREEILEARRARRPLERGARLYEVACCFVRLHRSRQTIRLTSASERPKINAAFDAALKKGRCSFEHTADCAIDSGLTWLKMVLDIVNVAGLSTMDGLEDLSPSVS
jgi:hypothetical protein